MRILVTGASGFLGSALCRRMASDGTTVRALVRTGRDIVALESAGVQVARGDVRDPAAVKEAMRDCSHVIHLAASRRSDDARTNTFREVNVVGTRLVASAALDAGVARFVYASTLGIHGFVTGGVLDESSPVRPNTPYRASKWAGEEAVREMHMRAGLPMVVARISTVVGVGASNWVPFAKGIAQGQLRLIGDGDNHIDLVAVDDLIDGLWRCAVTPSVNGKCFVLGGSESWTLRKFADAIARALGKPAPARGLPAIPYRVMLRAASSLFRLTGHHSAFAHGRELFVADKRSSSRLANVEIGYHATGSVNTAIESMIARFVEDGRVDATSSGL